MKKQMVLALALVLAAALLLPQLLLLDAQVTHSWIYTLLAALAFAAAFRTLAQPDRRLRRYALGFGFAFVLCQLAGARLDAADTLGGLRAAANLLFCSAALAPAGGFVFVLLVRGVEKIRLAEGQPSCERKVFAGTLGFILLCWLPLFLDYYPGMFNYDSTGEINQIVKNTFDANFPIVHTLLLGAFYRLGEWLGSYNTGIALYTIVQCVSLAAAMAYAVAYLYRLRCPGWLWLGAAALFGLLPVHGMLAMCTTKDLFFCAALLPLMIRLHMLWRHPEKWLDGKQCALVAALTAAMCFMRTNGVFAVLGVMIAAIPFFRQHRQARIRVMASLLAGIAMLGAGTALLNRVYQPQPGGIREWLSVPLMQVARVYDEAAGEGRTLKEAEEIEAFIPDVDRYQRHLADGVKKKATVGVVNMPDYLNLWGRLFVQYPADFFDAAAYLTKGYWHLDDDTHLDIYAERGDHGYLETRNQDGLGVTRDSRLPALMRTMDRLFVENEYRRIPLLATVVEPAFWCWAVCAVLLLAMYRRNRGTILCALMLAGLFVSMLLGPCSYIRYAYPMALCAPVLLGLLVSENRELIR